jgi:hypothetical protein
MDSEELVIVLLTGGGLALIGTVLGAPPTRIKQPSEPEPHAPAQARAEGRTRANAAGRLAN